ncbi:hypothetical protein [Arthrobacter sp. U41]|uniref:sunset domain-containing protein n=1 Tax=Arthrobacter sp. U41 TaxID=1849032 RepID=UPI001642D448|nr:hypothetical protein [Arthrobacter sp. U41]
MDWIIWLVVIAVIVAVVWWLLNRNSSRGRSGSADTKAGAETASTDDSTPPHLHDAEHGPSHRGALSGGGSSPSAAAAGLAWMPTSAGFNQAEPGSEPEPAPDPVAEAEDRAAVEAHLKARAAAAAAAAEVSGTEAAGANASGATAAPAESAPAESPEWETQWSETPPAEPHTAVHPEPVHGAGAHVAGAAGAGAAGATAATGAAAAGQAGAPVHHPEYTEPHAPTLPGAESAAAEAVLEAEPAGHLAADQPYGEGSAAASADGSGPEGFTVKGNASSMIYHEETSAAYEETRAEVWFLSAAHAEAAGFRPPRRTRQ